MKAFWPAVAAALLLAGCGRHAGTAAPITAANTPITAKAVPVKLLHDSLTVQDAAPAAEPVAAAATLGLTAPSCLGLTGCQDGTPLTLQNVDKKSQGLLWRELHVAGQVHNPGSMALSGQVTIKFLKKGTVVQTELRTIGNLAAGQSLAFSADSNDAADDADVTVSTAGRDAVQAR